MKPILVCFLGVLVFIETASSVAPYNTVYMQYNYSCRPDRNIPVGQGNWSRYGLLFDKEGDCYNLNSTCSLILSVQPGYLITTCVIDMDIDCDHDRLHVGDAYHGSSGYCGQYSDGATFNSKTNVVIIEFITGVYSSKCPDGFSMVYTTFHYGECTSNEFKCTDDGKCIPSEVKCDNYNNCGDWSDERDCPPSTGVIIAISVTFSLAFISCFAFVIRRSYRRRSRRRRRNTSRRNSVPATPSEPEPNMEPIAISTIQLIEPPKYVDAPPSYTDIYSNPAVDGVYETSNNDNGVDPPPTYESAVTHPCETNT